MYTRPYSESQGEIRIPENYVGNAFDEPEAIIHTKTIEEDACEKEESTPVSSFTKKEERRGRGIFSIFDKGIFSLEHSKIFSGLPFNLGSEEILLIGVALFLFLSKERDIETCIILILLLFIK